MTWTAALAVLRTHDDPPFITSCQVSRAGGAVVVAYGVQPRRLPPARSVDAIAAIALRPICAIVTRR